MAWSVIKAADNFQKWFEEKQKDNIEDFSEHRTGPEQSTSSEQPTNFGQPASVEQFTGHGQSFEQSPGHEQSFEQSTGTEQSTGFEQSEGIEQSPGSEQSFEHPTGMEESVQSMDLALACGARRSPPRFPRDPSDFSLMWQGDSPCPNATPNFHPKVVRFADSLAPRIDWPDIAEMLLDDSPVPQEVLDNTVMPELPSIEGLVCFQALLEAMVEDHEEVITSQVITSPEQQ